MTQLTAPNWPAMRRRLIAASSSLVILATLLGVPTPAWAALPAECSQVLQLVTCTYSTSGDHLFTVPAGVTSIDVFASGGQGDVGSAGGIGGRGATVTGTLAVTPGAVMHAVVGHDATGQSGGFNGGGSGGGGNCPGAGGGGASDLRSGTTLDSRVLVAAGGGGGGCRYLLASASAGGSAGQAGSGQGFPQTGYGGHAGCAPVATGGCSAGGQPAGFSLGAPGTGGDGSTGLGGAGGYALAAFSAAGGGGGGGYYGGGGGGDSSPYTIQPDIDGGGGGGGGGSNLVPAGGSSGLRTTGVPMIQISYTAPTPVASVGITPGSLDFGDQPVGSTGTQQLTISNSGDAGSTLTVLSLFTDSADYALSACVLPASLSVGQTCVVTVSFHPAATGTSSAHLSVVTDDPSEPNVQVVLTGNGTTPLPPQAGLSPLSLTFGNQLVGTTSDSQLVTVTNTAAVGSGTLHLGLPVIQGSNAPDFSIPKDPCSNASLAPGASCTVEITFHPTTTGARTAILRVSDDAANSPQDVTLTGTGVSPIARVGPASIDFGTVSVGTTSPHRTVTITNTGNLDLLLTSETITGSNASDFAFAGDTCITNFIAPGASCTIDLTFTPGAAGARSATLTISDNGLGSPHTVALTGTGGVPSADLAVSISASPNPVKTGQKVTYTITVYNAGPSSATNILVNDSLSSQSTFVSATISQGSCVTPVKGASGVISCSFASLASGSSQPIQIVVTVIAKKSSITNTVTVSAATADPNMVNNTAAITTRIK